MSQKIEIKGASGVAVDSRALGSQEDRLLGYTKDTSDFIKNIQSVLSSPLIMFTMILVVFILTIEIMWGSYFKTEDSKQFAKGTSEFIRAMTYFSWISGTILAFGVFMYFAGPMIFRDKFDDTDRLYIMIATAAMIGVYFWNCFVTGVRGEGTYTILGNFLTIK
jgi:magnesium-transporting ATPase (P-type)